jgi:ligand-binding SRPBCC domain-containing protein
MPVNVEQVSIVRAPAEAVWSRAVTPEGINHEMRPWLRMTMPAGLRGSTIDDVRVGETVGRSWILALGFLPVDYDDLCLAELEPGRRFLERSTMFSMRLWQHERIVEPAGAGSSRVTDRLSFELRRLPAAVPGSSRLARWIVSRLFAHRHRRLRTWALGP